MGEVEEGVLFESKSKISKLYIYCYRVFALSVLACVVGVWGYRVIHFPATTNVSHRLWWSGMLAAEVWFGFYWILTQSVRWNLVFRRTFKHRLSHRYEKELPKVDIFVCTADPTMEPPVMVINTVLSVMAYDYPPEKLSVYLSDDGGSELTFYALLQASVFSKHWLPYCKKYKVEPRSPAAYFSASHHSAEGSFDDVNYSKDLASIKKLYEDLKNRIESAIVLGRIPEDVRSQHKGFLQWDSFSSRSDHDTILQILIGGRNRDTKDIEGCTLPNLVYLAREKRPQHPHHFKAGAMNALIRVSSKISNGQIILNVDCDMYSNNSQSIRDALCFFMDEQKGNEIAYVQFPQSFENVTRNDVYGACMLSPSEVDLHGMDGLGGTIYIGTGCFHRRDTLCGRVLSKDQSTSEWKRGSGPQKTEDTAYEQLEESLKDLASCTFEDNTLWGIEMGLKYGVLVEDIATGLSIKCNGWKSVYFNPERKGFLGVAATSLDTTLVQHKRWSEGHMQVLFSKYSAIRYGFGRINPGLIMAYCIYGLWAPCSLATLYYCIIPCLHLPSGIPLFPQISSPWFIPFAYIIVSQFSYSFVEFQWCGGTVQGWWNEQRIWLYKRTSSYFFAVVDNIIKLVGYSNMKFIVTPKGADQDDASQRYEQEIMEFGTSSPMLMMLATLAVLYLFCFASVAKHVFVGVGFVRAHETMAIQIVLSLFLVMINLPIYQALFVRQDTGKLPSSLLLACVSLAFFAWYDFMYVSEQDTTLVQHKRWSEGHMQVLFSKYSAIRYGFGRINPGLIMAYCIYGLWAPCSLATLYYCIIPCLHLPSGIPLFPQISSPWFIPFAYIIVSQFSYSFVEFQWCGGTVQGWWNEQRIWLYKRTSSYFFAVVDNIIKLVGYSNMKFIVTPKGADQDDASQRYEQEIMEFGTSSPMLMMLATLAVLYLFCFASVAKHVFVGVGFVRAHETMAIQIVLSLFLVMINLPIYQALFVRQDTGKLPSSLLLACVSLAFFACTCFSFLY